MLRLLAPTEHAYVAKMILLYFAQFGIPVEVQYASAEDVRYAVFSTGDYDLALLGWRLSDYPGYLCDWFQSPGTFAMQDPVLARACDSLRSTADLATAQQAAREAQAALMQSLPFIPLFQGVIYEGYRNLAYPFDSVPDGLSRSLRRPGICHSHPLRGGRSHTTRQ